MFQKYILIRENATFKGPYICKIRAFFIDLEHPAGGNGPRGAGFAATCRHGTTEWPRLSRRMRERPAPRSTSGKRRE